MIEYRDGGRNRSKDGIRTWKYTHQVRIIVHGGLADVYKYRRLHFTIFWIPACVYLVHDNAVELHAKINQPIQTQLKGWRTTIQLCMATMTSRTPLNSILVLSKGRNHTGLSGDIHILRLSESQIPLNLYTLYRQRLYRQLIDWQVVEAHPGRGGD